MSEITKAAKSTYQHLFCELRYYSDFNFRAYVGSKNGGVVFDCPGDACGVYPSIWPSKNVDNAAQQITLLAGLAARHDKARREIKTY